MGARDTVHYLTRPLGVGDPSHVAYTSTIEKMPLVCCGTGNRYLGRLADKRGSDSPREVMVETTDALRAEVDRLARPPYVGSVRLLGPPGVGKSSVAPVLLARQSCEAIVLLEPFVGLCRETVRSVNRVAGAEVAVVVDGEVSEERTFGKDIRVMTPARYVAGNLQEGGDHAIPERHILMHDEAHESDWASYLVRNLYSRGVFAGALLYVQLSASIAAANARGVFPGRGVGMHSLQVEEVDGISDPSRWVLHSEDKAMLKPWSVTAMHNNKTIIFIDGDLMSHRLHQAYDAAGLMSFRLDRMSDAITVDSVLQGFSGSTSAVLVLDSSFQSGYNIRADRVIDTGSVRATVYDPTTGSVADEVRYVSLGERHQRVSRVGRFGPGKAYTIAGDMCHRFEADLTGEERYQVMAGFCLLGAKILVTDRFAYPDVSFDDVNEAYGFLTSGMPWKAWATNPIYPIVPVCASSPKRENSKQVSNDSDSCGPTRGGNTDNDWMRYIQEANNGQKYDVEHDVDGRSLWVCDQTQGMNDALPVPLMFVGHDSVLEAISSNGVAVEEMDYSLRIYTAYAVCREYNGVLLHRVALDDIAKQIPCGLDARELPKTIVDWLIATYAKLNKQQFHLNKLMKLILHLRRAGLTFSTVPIDLDVLTAVQSQLLPVNWFDMLHTIATFMDRKNHSQETKATVNWAAGESFKTRFMDGEPAQPLLSESAWLKHDPGEGMHMMKKRVEGTPGTSIPRRAVSGFSKSGLLPSSSSSSSSGYDSVSTPSSLFSTRNKSKWQVGAKTWYAPGVIQPDGKVSSGRAGRYCVLETPNFNV